ncbi:hypothetical protein LJR045_001901 [Microbacterium sp. LjRoot45]|uniref:hypothetical protein n=1 Tax=Microbacterium sp. LjRoot45 TaxID=3342329 RepID=UPI003ECFE5D7
MPVLAENDAVASDVGRVTWAQVEAGFHVGSRAGDFLGYVDHEPGGAYRAYDMSSRPLGAFTRLSDAIDAVNSHREEVTPS